MHHAYHSFLVSLFFAMRISLLSLLIGVWTLLPYITYAQQPDAQTNLGDLLIRFCNDPAEKSGTKELKMSTIPNQEEDICVYLVNGGPTDVTVELGFVDGTITNDAEQKKACEPEGTKTQFGQWVTIEKTTIEVPAKSTIETHAKLKFGPDVAGMVYGCATARIVDDQKMEGMFDVISRRANFIDVSVKGKLRAELNIVDQPLPAGWIVYNNDPRFYLIGDPTTKELYGKIVVRNDGNVTQYVSLQPTISWLGKIEKQETISKKVLPHQENEFKIAITNKPFREGPVSFDAEITHTPVFDDGITDEDKPDARPTTINLTAKAFFIPRNLLFIVLGVLFLGLIASSLGKKKNKD